MMITLKKLFGHFAERVEGACEGRKRRVAVVTKDPV